jgi:predicted permease
MTAILKPIAFLLIIVAAYLVKRAGLFKPRDYRVMQVVVFDFTLPASIIVSFATNPHHLSMLLISPSSSACCRCCWCMRRPGTSPSRTARS